MLLLSAYLVVLHRASGQDDIVVGTPLAFGGVHTALAITITTGGGAGDDLIIGRDGNDFIFGDTGSDILWGGLALLGESKFRLADSEILNHRVEVVEGVLAAEVLPAGARPASIR